MPSDYPSKIVLIGFFVQNKTAGTKDDRDRFSEDLFTRFNGHIVAACTAAGLPDVSDEARAIMAVMALNAPGAAAGTKAGRAVEGYLTHRGF
jgi:hypothetical protein